MSPLVALVLWLYAAAMTALALTVAYVWVALYLAVHGNWRARTIAAAMIAALAALVLWAATR